MFRSTQIDSTPVSGDGRGACCFGEINKKFDSSVCANLHIGIIKESFIAFDRFGVLTDKTMVTNL